MSEAGQPTYRLEDLKQRWEKNPNSRLYLQLAEEYHKHERVEEAVAVLEQGLEQRPADLSAHVALGRYSVELGQMEQAVTALEAAVERDPTHLVASKLLLEVHLQRGDVEKAGELLEIYRLLNDRDPELEHLEYRLHGLRESPAPGGQEVVQPARSPTAAEAELEELISGRRQPGGPGEQSAPGPRIDLEATQPNLLAVDLPDDPMAAASSEVEATSTVQAEASALAREPFPNPPPEASMSADFSNKAMTKGTDIFDLGSSAVSLPGFDDFWGQLPAEASSQPLPEVAESAEIAEFPESTEVLVETEHAALSEPIAVSEPTAVLESLEPSGLEATAVEGEVDSEDSPAARSVGEYTDDVFDTPTADEVAEKTLDEPFDDIFSTAESEPESLVTDPAASDPVASDPVASDPVASDPVASDPVASDPWAEISEVTVDSQQAGDEVASFTAEEVEPVVEPSETGFEAQVTTLGDVFEEQEAPVEIEALAIEPAEALAEPSIFIDSPALENDPVFVEEEPSAVELGRDSEEEAAGPDEVAGPLDVAVPESTVAAQEAAGVAAQEVVAAVGASEAAGDEDEEVATVTLGGLYLKQGHLDEAARIYEQVLARDPKNHAALAGLSLSKKPKKTGLTAMDLLADRSLSGTIPAGVTAKKVMILSNYLKHLKTAGERNHVR